MKEKEKMWGTVARHDLIIPRLLLRNQSTYNIHGTLFNVSFIFYLNRFLWESISLIRDRDTSRYPRNLEELIELKLLRTKCGYKTGIRIGIKGWSDFVFWVTFLRPPHFHRRHVLLTFRGTRANCCTTRNGRARLPPPRIVFERVHSKRLKQASY